MSQPTSVLHLSDNEITIFQQFRRQNQTLFVNKIIENFFKDSRHIRSFVRALENRTPHDRHNLESLFRRFLFQIRFTTYLHSIVRYSVIDFYRKLRKDRQRNVLIFDKTIDESGNILGESLINVPFIEEEKPSRRPESFIQTIENEKLFAALCQLTDRQKFVIALTFSSNDLDTEIAKKLQVSQQAVTKTKKTALVKMKRFILSKI